MRRSTVSAIVFDDSGGQLEYVEINYPFLCLTYLNLDSAFSVVTGQTTLTSASALLRRRVREIYFVQWLKPPGPHPRSCFSSFTALIFLFIVDLPLLLSSCAVVNP